LRKKGLKAPIYGAFQRMLLQIKSTVLICNGDLPGGAGWIEPGLEHLKTRRSSGGKTGWKTVMNIIGNMRIGKRLALGFALILAFSIVITARSTPV